MSGPNFQTPLKRVNGLGSAKSGSSDQPSPAT